MRRLLAASGLTACADALWATYEAPGAAEAAARADEAERAAAAAATVMREKLMAYGSSFVVVKPPAPDAPRRLCFQMMREKLMARAAVTL